MSYQSLAAKICAWKERPFATYATYCEGLFAGKATFCALASVANTTLSIIGSTNSGSEPVGKKKASVELKPEWPMRTRQLETIVSSTRQVQ